MLQYLHLKYHIYSKMIMKIKFYSDLNSLKQLFVHGLPSMHRIFVFIFISVRFFKGKSYIYLNKKQ